jgi:hypothetical protein
VVTRLGSSAARVSGAGAVAWARCHGVPPPDGARSPHNRPRNSSTEAGAYRAATDRFRLRPISSPKSPPAGSIWAMRPIAIGRRGRAAAWTRAARLAPRDAGIQRAAAVAPADAAAARCLVAPLTPGRGLADRGGGVAGGWAGILWARSFRGRWVVLLAGGALLFGVSAALDRWYRVPVAVATVMPRSGSHPTSSRRRGRGSSPRRGAGAARAGRLVPCRSRRGAQAGWMRAEDLEPVIRPARS